MRARLLPIALILAGVSGAVGATGMLVADAHAPRPPAVRNVSAAPVDPAPNGAQDPIAKDIATQQATLRMNPNRAPALAALGLDYVQEAKITVNPAYYPKATAVLARSLALDHSDNYVAMAGEAALNAAEHNFAAARRWALRGLAIDPQSSILYGALDDADTQLGLYQQAFEAAQRMNDLYPGVPSFTRAEYVYELRGQIPLARAAMQTALRQAIAPADKAFAYYYLGELAFNNGDPRTALADDMAGLRADPSYAALLEGKAKAEAALGQNAAAVRDYLTVVSEVPQPQYVVEAGDLLDSLGNHRLAQQEYHLFTVENHLFTANGVTLDTDPTLFYADHGQPALALHYGQIGIRIRPFVEMDDAYAWALHVNHRDAEALAWERRAMALGTRNALFYFHAGMIEKSLGSPSAARADLVRSMTINPYFSPLLEPIRAATLAQLGGHA